MSKQIRHMHKDQGIHEHKTKFPHKQENIELLQLKEIHNRYFKDYLAIRRKESDYRRAFYEYLKAAETTGLSLEDAHNFHKKAVYKQASKLRAGCQGGQHPGAIVFSNSSEDYSFSIFSSGAKIDEGHRLVNGAFGGAINVRKSKHLDQTSDFISSAYMNGHMVNHGTPVAYELFVVSVSKAERGTEAEQNTIELGLERRQRFINDWRAAGFEVEENGSTPVRLMYTNDTVARIPLPLVMHDLGECRYYVIDKGKEIPFEQWVKENGLETHEAVKNHLLALQDHRSEAPYFNELVKMTRVRKGLYCVDSRHLRQNGSVIKDLGAIATEEQRRRILETAGIKNIVVCLHFNCGYLQTAMGVHEAGAEIRQAIANGIAKGKKEEAEAVLQSLRRKIEEISRGEWTGFDLNVFSARITELNGRPLSKSTLHLLKELLTSQFSDTRNTAQHMMARNMLTWDEKLNIFVMPAAAELDATLRPKNKVLPKNRTLDEKNDLMRKEYYYKITVLEAKRQKDAWEATRQEMEKERSLKNSISIKVHIENFETGKVAETLDGKSLYDPMHSKKAI